MKLRVFANFLDLVEHKFGLEIVDKIIIASNLSLNGINSEMNSYRFSEMLQLLKCLSSYTSIPLDDLLLVYGKCFSSAIKLN